MSEGERLPLVVARGAVIGVLAGSVAFAVDVFLAQLTLRYPLAIRPQYLAAYLLVGLALGVIVAVGLRFLRGPLAQPHGRVLGATLLILYAAAAAERLQFIGNRVEPWMGAVAAALGVAVVFSLPWLLARWLPIERPGTYSLVVALLVAVGLAANSNLLPRPLSPKSLAVDVALLALAVGVATGYSRLGPKRGSVLATAVAAGVAIAFSWAVGATAPLVPPAATPPQSASATRPPHLVLAVVDTLRFDVFESVVAETPEGRAFAESIDNAAWFSKAIAASPWTVPSMGSILTGLHPPEHDFGRRGDGGRVLRLHGSVVSIAQRLAAAGYFNAAFVANPYLDVVTGIDRGFHFYQMLHSTPWKLPLVRVLFRSGLLREWPYADATSVRRSIERELPRLGRSDAPLFLWVHLMDPHAHLHTHAQLPPEADAAAQPELDRKYREEVRFALLELTRVLRALGDSGLLEESAVIVLSDHGEMLPSDERRIASRYGHGHAMYEELLHVPMVIRPPGGLDQPRRVDVLTSHVDIPGTVADLLDLPLDVLREGRLSLVPHLGPEGAGGPGSSGRTYVVASANGTGPRQRVVRRDDWKLIAYPDGEREAELYQMTADPLERINRAASQPDVLRSLQHELQLHWASTRHPRESRRGSIQSSLSSSKRLATSTSRLSEQWDAC